MSIELEIHEPAGGPMHFTTCPSRRTLTLLKDGERVLVIKMQCSSLTSHTGEHHAMWGESRVEWSGPDWIEQWYRADET